MISLNSFEKMNLVPIEVERQLLQDIKTYGVELDRELIKIKALG